mmetsp:Transcript_4662/g.6847  ORF Transcript_4662/g.6847 Transcript_4662/m.6847 type:complete len:99 (-) Transcript_4662:682-978(-)
MHSSVLNTAFGDDDRKTFSVVVPATENVQQKAVVVSLRRESVIQIFADIVGHAPIHLINPQLLRDVAMTTLECVVIVIYSWEFQLLRMQDGESTLDIR